MEGKMFKFSKLKGKGIVFVVPIEPERTRQKTLNQEISVWEDSYFNEMQPIIIILQLLARFPFHVIDKDMYSMKIGMKCLIYLIIMYSFQAWLTVQNIIVIIAIMMESQNDYDTTLRCSIMLTVLVLQVFTPLFVKAEGQSFFQYLNQWKKFQVHYEAHMGKSTQTSMRKYIIAAICVMIPSAVAATILATTSFISMSWYHTFPYCIVFFAHYLHLFIWLFTCIRIMKLSQAINRRIITTLLYHWDKERSKKLSRYRQLWMELSELTQDLGKTTIRYTGVTLLVFLTINIITVYSTILSIINRQFTPHCYIYIAIWVYVGGYFVLICDLAHRTSQQVGEGLSNYLVKVNTEYLNLRDSKEVGKLIKAMILNKPVIKLLGTFELNRTSLTFLIERVVKYVIISLQFKSKE